MSESLSSLFSQGLSKASRVLSLPTIDNATQELVRSALVNLTTLNSRIEALSLFSPNETLDDISTTDLIYLLVPFVLSEVRGRIRTTEREDRISVLKQTQKDLRGFLSNLESYEIVKEEEQALFGKKASVVTDPAKRRQLKIQQYQKEKDLRIRIETLRKKRDQQPISQEILTDFDVILSLLPTKSLAQGSTDDDELDSDTDDIVRETTLLLLRLFYGQSHSQLDGMNQELELLLNAPPPSHGTDSDHRNLGQEDSDMWKLDVSSPGLVPGDKGPLLDPSGKPLRPFTILPSDAAQRARLQAQVFGPDHRLPTMSIDEYLQIERDRGNILTGGGPASEAAPTSTEKLQVESEMDGTKDGEEKAEAKRLKDENWSVFTDENPKGAGNTMNRG